MDETDQPTGSNPKLKTRQTEALLSTLQKTCKPGIWSKGIAWARSNCVSFEDSKNSDGASELTFLVKSPEATLAVRVQIWPEDEDYFSDCQENTDPCPHVIAAMVALQNDTLKSVEKKKMEGLRYFLEFIGEDQLSKKNRLSITRYLGANDASFRGSLIAHIGGQKSGRIPGPLLNATRPELQLDEILQEYRGRLVDSGFWYRVTPLLAQIPGLILKSPAGETIVNVAAQILSPRVSVTRQGHEFELKVIRHEGIDEIVDGIFARRDRTLHFINNPRLEERERALVNEAGTRFSGGERVDFLFNQLLPALREKKIQVEVAAADIPVFQDFEPQLKLIAQPLAELRVGVVARIEYDSPTPFFRKNSLREAQLQKEAFEKFGLRIGEYRQLQGEDALNFLLKFKDSDSMRSESFYTPELQPLSTLALVSQLLQANAQRGESAQKETSLLTPLHRRQLKQAFGLESAPSQRFRPSTFSGELRAYQEQGVQWILDSFSDGLGVILADDMGLGKTIQTLATLPAGSLIVAPTSMLWTWESQMKKFRKDLNPRIFHGRDRQSVLRDSGIVETRELETPDAYSGRDVIITSYGLLRQDIDLLKTRAWNCVVFDESQFLKNRDTKLFDAASAIRARSRLALTGTPIENRRDDLAAQLELLNPALPEVLPYAKFLVLRRHRKDVLTELPLLTQNQVMVELSEAERELYEALLLSVRKDVLAQLQNSQGAAPDASPELSLFTMLEHLLRLRQASCHQALLPPEFRAKISADVFSDSSKVEALRELVEETQSPPENRKKIIIFSQWTSFLDLVEASLKKHFATDSFLRLDGSTRDRHSVVEQFQEDAGKTILLMSLKAGGIGLNLTAAEHVFLLDPWWNPATEEQAIARAHRMGQTKPVFVYRLLARNTVEERVAQIQALKRQELAELFEGDETNPDMPQNREAVRSLLKELVS